MGMGMVLRATWFEQLAGRKSLFFLALALNLVFLDLDLDLDIEQELSFYCEAIFYLGIRRPNSNQVRRRREYP